MWHPVLALRRISSTDIVIDTPTSAAATVAASFDPELVARIPYA